MNKLKIMKKIIFSLVFSLLIVLPTGIALAETGNMNNNNTSTSPKLDNPLGNVETPQVLIGQIIDAVLGIVGSLALLMFVYGGITWMTSSGSPEKIKKGRDIIVWSAIGLAIVFSAYGLTRVLIQGLTG